MIFARSEARRLFLASGRTDSPKRKPRFDMLQDPEQFNEAPLHSLSHPHAQDGEQRAARERENSNHS